MRLPTVPGLEVALSINGQNMQEYDDETDVDGAEHTRFVEAISGANFAVELRSDRMFTWKHNDLEVCVHLDGPWAAGRIFAAESMKRGYGTCTISNTTEHRHGRSFTRKFTFADLTTTDGAPKPELKKQLANLGEISVKIYRVRKTGTRRADYDSSLETALGSAGIPEKALKGRAISNRATLGKEESTSVANFATVEYPWGKAPVAVYTFKYRSRKDMQIEGIIERSPSPVPGSAVRWTDAIRAGRQRARGRERWGPPGRGGRRDRDPETLTPAEKDELIRIQRQKLQDQAKIKKEKRERDEDDGEEEGNDDEVTMTSTRSKRPRLSNDSGVEVIDLSNETDGEDD